MKNSTEQEEALAKLTAYIGTGLSYFHDGFISSLQQYTVDVILPQLEDILAIIHNSLIRYHMFSDVSGGSNKTPIYVVHYTGIGTLVSMLQAEARRKLHLSNVNQSSSLKPAKGTSVPNFGATLRLYDSAHFNDPDDGDYLARHLNPESVRKWITPSTNTHAYIASFIIPHKDADTAADNLVFWRTYGREGEGCSMKLRTPKSRIRRVLYRQKDLGRAVSALEPVLECVGPLFEIEYRWLREELTRTIWRSLGSLQYLYKSPAYRYERECRVVMPDSAHVKQIASYEYNDQTRRLRHYCENGSLDVANILTSGSSITIGPCVSDKDDLCRSLEVLKSRAGLIGTEIRTSEISYRRT